MFAVLDDHRVRYLVIGGLAAAMWGSDLPRTSDADITPARNPANLDRLAAALIELEARLRISGDPDGVTVPLDRKTFIQDVVCLITRHGPLDISFVPDGTTGYDGLAPCAVIRPIGSHPGVAIADLADLADINGGSLPRSEGDAVGSDDAMDRAWRAVALREPVAVVADRRHRGAGGRAVRSSRDPDAPSGVGHDRP
jgi:hypothetical protein